MKKSLLRLLAALACSSASALAAAQGTGLGADSDVAEAGDCEVETVFERSKKRGEATQRGSALRFACGIGWRTELEATMEWTRSGSQRERVLALDAKTTLREREDGGGIGWALGLGIDAQRIDGRWRRSADRIELEASRQFGAAWLGEAHIGTLRDRASRRRSTTWALSAEYAWSEITELKAELAGDDRDKPFLALGWRRAIWSEDLQLKLTWAERLGSPREQSLALALQYEF